MSGSTKIYQAYKWNKSFDELLEHLEALRQLEYAKFTTLMVNVLKIGVTNPADVMDVIRDFMQRGTNSPMNPKASVCLYHHEGVWYPHYFGIDVAVLEPFEKAGDMEDFHYQNHTDPPEEVAEKDWEHRLQVWEKIYERYSTPAHAGLIFEIMDRGFAMRAIFRAQELIAPRLKELKDTPISEIGLRDELVKLLIDELAIETTGNLRQFGIKKLKADNKWATDEVIAEIEKAMQTFYWGADPDGIQEEVDTPDSEEAGEASSE